MTHAVYVSVSVSVSVACAAVRSYNLVTMDTCLYGANASTAAPVVFRQHTCASTASRLPNSDCVLSQWSYWSRCSAECSGTTTRTRLVALPATGTGSCPSVPLSETQSCSAPCPYVVGAVGVAVAVAGGTASEVARCCGCGCGCVAVAPSVHVVPLRVASHACMCWHVPGTAATACALQARRA